MTLPSDDRRGLWELPLDELLGRFIAETQHDTGSTARTYAGHISAALRRFEREHGHLPSMSTLLADSELLARLLRCDRSLYGDRRVSQKTIKATRSALAAFVAWLPEPERSRARAVLLEARRCADRRRGLRLLVDAGRPPEEDSRFVPTAIDIQNVIAALRASEHPLAPTCADLVAVAYLTGARVGALLEARRSGLQRLTDGRWWLFLAEKARDDRRPLLVRSDRPELLVEWAALPPDAHLWASSERRLLPGMAWRLLHDACEQARVPHFSFHRLRHAFASDLAARSDIGVVKAAGGWATTLVAEDYVHRRRVPEQ